MLKNTRPVDHKSSTKSPSANIKMLAFLLYVVILFMAGVATAHQASAQADVYRGNQGSPGRKTVGFGFSNPYQSTAAGYPSFGMPQDVGNGFYSVKAGSVALPMWKAPSGYLYPWAPRPESFSYAYPMPVLAVSKINQSTAPAVPPLAVEIQDLGNYLEKAKLEKRMAEADISRLSAKIAEIKEKERALRVAGFGNIDPSDEAQMRRELQQIGSECSSKTKP
ncbi:hypothetical protein GC174_09840 [bacterium]|nr:hypothetical protein [bacterium]